MKGIQRKISNWATRRLSYSIRVLLINIVLASVLRFWACLFMFPCGLINEIEKLCRKFLWTGELAEKSGSMVAWSVVYQPKARGGLGIKELLSWNKALMFNWVCDLDFAYNTLARLQWVCRYKLNNYFLFEMFKVRNMIVLGGTSCWGLEMRCAVSLEWGYVVNDSAT